MARKFLIGRSMRHISSGVQLAITTGIFCLSFFFASNCSAEIINPLSPVTCDTDINFHCNPSTKPETGCATTTQGCGISVDSLFSWRPISGAVKYILDIDKFTQSEDNIYPDKYCLDAGQCKFNFTQLTCCRITYSDKYCWGLTAYDTRGNLIGFSPGSCFTTEPPPPGDSGEPTEPGFSEWIKNPIAPETLEDTLDFLLNSLFLIMLAIAVIMVIWAAVLFVTSGGDPKKISSAKKIILWAVIAIAIALLAKGVPTIIRGLTK